MVAIAKEHGKELTLEQAKALLDRVKGAYTGELSDDDVEAIAGGKDIITIVREGLGDWVQTTW